MASLNGTEITFSDFLSKELHVIDYTAYTKLGSILLILLTSLAIRQSFVPASGNAAVKAPFVGSTSITLTRFQFFRNGRRLINEGYAKFKDGMFKLSRNDILVIPIRYVEEIRNYPDHKLSSIQANIDNFEGVHSVANILLESNLHTRMVQQKLNPKLGLFTPIMREALEESFEKELPNCEENAFKCIIGLWYFPDWLKVPAAWLMPSAWIVSSCLRTTKQMIGAEVVRRCQEQSRADLNEVDKPIDFIQFMMDNANEVDGQPHKRAHMQLILSLASIHTTSMACTQTLFDLISHPEYIPVIREEVEQVLKEDGGWKKTSLTKMRKLDSFMRESQRLNPPSLLGFKRCAKEDVTLSDGTFLPKGAHTVCPIEPILLLPSIYPNPHTFDPLRSYNLRKQPNERNKHQFATISPESLHFGHGKYSFPGRFFAGNVIKIVAGTLLLKYEVGFEGGGMKRPENWPMHEYNFPNPEARVALRKRKGGVAEDWW